MASKYVFILSKLFHDLNNLSVANMGGFKTELLRRLHDELDCFPKFYPFIIASYLNINFKGRLVSAEDLEEAKSVLLDRMCDVAVEAGDYTLPETDVVVPEAETVIEDSQPPLNDFGSLVLQLSQPMGVRPTTPSPSEVKWWKSWLCGTVKLKLHAEKLTILVGGSKTI